MIEVKGLSFSYGRMPVLNDVSFLLRHESVTGILGRNGAGKTTLLKCLNRLQRPRNGEIVVDGREIRKIDSSELPKMVAYVSQSSSEEPMTVFDYVLLGRKPYIRYRSSDHDLDRVEKLLHFMGMSDHAFSLTCELSGGEFQKVKIARALVGDPKILLLDEPTNNLDLKSQVKIMELVRHVAKEHGLTVLISVHDINLAFRYCDELMLLKDKTVYAFDQKDRIGLDLLEAVYDIGLVSVDSDGTRLFVPNDRGSR